MVQGGEGGGHTGTGARPRCCCRRSLDAVDIPVVAAGGFFDGRGLAAALSYGAAGVGMGTRFLLTQDSTVPDAVKQLYLDARPRRHRRHREGRRHAAPDAAHRRSSRRSRRPARVQAARARRCAGPWSSSGRAGCRWRELAARRPRDAQGAGPHPGADDARREHPDDAQGRAGRGRHRRRRARQRPGRRRDRRPADAARSWSTGSSPVRPRSCAALGLPGLTGLHRRTPAGRRRPARAPRGRRSGRRGRTPSSARCWRCRARPAAGSSGSRP